MGPPTSVVLPTTTFTPVVEEVADQLEAEDELLVVCDHDSDPVAKRVGDVPGARLVVAGDPEGCSGKANAIAAGMRAADHDRLVWTDDDFHHPADWLSGLHDAYEEDGPSTELPFFVGRDPLSVLLEPVYALGGTLGVYVGGKAWAGAVVFERDDLDWDGFLRDLTRTISDDGLLSEYLDVTPVKRVRRVEVGGSLRATLERHVRFTRIVRRHDPGGSILVGALTMLLAAVCLLVPVYGFLGVTALVSCVYGYFGIRRWTVLCAYPGILLQAPLFAYALARRTFVWGGRRYQWPSMFEVTVESDSETQ